MNFTFNHFNFNVKNLEKSLEFYNKALGLKEINRIVPEDKSFIIVYLGDGVSDFSLELTWLKDRDEAYDLGECEYHLALVADDFNEAYKKHQEMGCICFENKAMGIYFIEDLDGYWIEIIPKR